MALQPAQPPALRRSLPRFAAHPRPSPQHPCAMPSSGGFTGSPRSAGDVGVAPMTRQNRPEQARCQADRALRGAFRTSERQWAVRLPSHRTTRPCFRYSMKNGSWPNGVTGGRFASHSNMNPTGVGVGKPPTMSQSQVAHPLGEPPNSSSPSPSRWFLPMRRHRAIIQLPDLG